MSTEQIILTKSDQEIVNYLNSKHELSYVYDMFNLTDNYKIEGAIMIPYNANNFQMSKYYDVLNYVSSIYNMDNIFYLDIFYNTNIGYLYKTKNCNMKVVDDKCEIEMIGVTKHIRPNVNGKFTIPSFHNSFPYAGKFNYEIDDDTEEVYMTFYNRKMTDFTNKINLNIFDNILLDTNSLDESLIEIHNVKSVSYIAYVPVNTIVRNMQKSMKRMRCVNKVDSDKYYFTIKIDYNSVLSISNISYEINNDENPVELYKIQKNKYKNDEIIEGDNLNIKCFSTHRQKMLSDTKYYLSDDYDYYITNVKGKISYDVQYYEKQTQTIYTKPQISNCIFPFSIKGDTIRYLKYSDRTCSVV